MRRIFSELVPLAELSRHPVLAELAARRIQLLAAVQPGFEDGARALVLRARELDLSIGLWPLLDDADGRWLSRGNAARFEAHARRVLELAPLDAVVLDLEPPIALVRRALRGEMNSLLRFTTEQSSQRVASLVRELRSSGAEVLVAVPPPVIPGRAGDGFERAFGIAELDAREATICPMLYTSLLEGYGRGVVRRADARALFARWSAAALERWGARVCIGLGCAGVGALGDERAWRDVSELEDDVAIACASDLALFDLAGVLARGEVGRWLDALSTPRAVATPPSTLRSMIIDASARALGRLLPR